MAAFSIRTVRTFAASHQLRLPGGGLEPLHGHNWKVAVTVAADRLDAVGCVMDFHVLERLTDAAVTPLHNRHLNDVPPFDAELNPSAENVAVHVARSVAAAGLPAGVRVAKVRVWETAGNSAEHRPGRPAAVPAPTLAAVARPPAPVASHRCEVCGRTATLHLIEVVGGRRVDRYVCEACDDVRAAGPNPPPRAIDLLLRLVARARRPAGDGAA